MNIKKEEDFFKDHLGSKVNMEFYPHRLLENNINEAKDADYLVCFVYSDLSNKNLDKLTDLKGIATMSVGTDHIDLNEAKRKER